MATVVFLSGCGAGDEFSNRKQPLRIGTETGATHENLYSSQSNLLWGPGNTDKSFGIHLCLNGAQEAVFKEVQPVSVVGEVEVLGAFIATSVGPDLGWVSADGFPPSNAPDSAKFVPLEGGAFTQQCGDEGPSIEHVLVGLRGVDDGGGWDGVRVVYEVEGKQYELNVDVGMFFCGAVAGECNLADDE
jgi:hypothetical protein